MPLVDRSEEQKANRVDALREELKALGYSVVSTKWLVALQIQAKRIKASEVNYEETTNPRSHQGQGSGAAIGQSEIA